MKNNTILFILLIISIIISISLLLKPKDIKNDYTILDVKSKIDTFYQVKDTIIYKTNVKIIHDTTIIPDKIDTDLVINSFFERKILFDSISSNENYILILDTLNQNNLEGRSVKFHIVDKTILKQDSIFIENKFKPFLFIGGNYNITNNNVGVNLGYQFKKFNVYTSYNNGINIGINIKI